MMAFEATNQVLFLFVTLFLPLTGKSNLKCMSLVLHEYNSVDPSNSTVDPPETNTAAENILSTN